ncbi:hypothetical protein DRO66_00610 [Candidatus Bathyarchaeota archaeon]|nr:MAG: hypothetical protein DRO66_00610 [Candidatus Bathyarchaeota archaeon]
MKSTQSILKNMLPMFSLLECGRCGSVHKGYSGKLDSKGVEYVVCGETNKRMNVIITGEVVDVMFATLWEVDGMKTVTILIGNSDNKLSQQRWSLYCNSVSYMVKSVLAEVHFTGGSPYCARWQNACYVGQIEDKDIPQLKKVLKEVRETYDQDSVAITISDTEFI